jgi:hypothetical protein
MGQWSDDDIASRVNDIATALIALVCHALEHNDQGWLARHQGRRDATARRFKDRPAMSLDG